MTVYIVRDLMCRLMSKLDRTQAGEVAQVVPTLFEVLPDNDPEVKVAFVLNVIHEPWDETFPRQFLEERPSYARGIASRKLEAIVRDPRFSRSMRMKAALILWKWGKESDVMKLLGEAKLFILTQRPDWQKWATLIGVK